MSKIVILVFVGGAVGAVLREFAMLMVPTLSRGFPLDILVANLLAGTPARPRCSAAQPEGCL